MSQAVEACHIAPEVYCRLPAPKMFTCFAVHQSLPQTEAVDGNIKHVGQLGLEDIKVAATLADVKHDA